MLTKVWKWIRESVDRRLEFDPNPPVVIDREDTKIIVSDGLHPEANAMALAMYSRSPKSFLIHLSEVMKKGWKKFLQTFYVGYGHKSIGDCGSTTICAEGVSMLVAKAVQDTETYDGQEASTRYLNMKKMRVLNPLNTEAGKTIQDEWMNFYSFALDRMITHLSEKFPRLPEDDPNTYEKAVKAKAFDICRSFLPAGCTTYVGWHTNLRQAADHVKEMQFHPLAEVRMVAGTILEALQQKYPSSFGAKSYKDQDAYYASCGNVQYENMKFDSPFSYTHTFSATGISEDATLTLLLNSRPQKTELPRRFKRVGQITYRFILDFGSYRDIQRHRSCTQAMPLLTTEHGFNKWYLESLPVELEVMAQILIEKQMAAISLIEDENVRQYYIAMGFNVACELTATLPSATYIAELRSGQTVHPTLRPVAQQMGTALKSVFPEMALHIDYSPDEWSTKRGTHDIVRKDE